MNKCLKRLIIATAVLAGGMLLHAGERGPEMAEFNIQKPWTSKALSPVKMETVGDKDFTLLDNGKAACDIVIPSSGEHVEYYREVAGCLKRYLDSACGVSFNIVNDASVSRNGIYLGECNNPFIKKYYAETIAKLPEEGFAVVRFKDGILLAGKDGASPVKDMGKLKKDSISHLRGTFFATCDFLERMLGFRFYFPGKLGTHIPYYNGQTVTLPAVAYTDHPVFPLRKSSYANYDTVDAAILKAPLAERVQWDRMLKTGDVEFQNFGHTDLHWEKAYGKTHPEFFAMRADGTRMNGDRGAFSSQRCYSDKGGFEEHLVLIERAYKGEKLLDVFGSEVSRPNNLYIYWWPNDGFKGCACTACMKLTDPKSAFPHSRLIWDYILRLSAAVKQKWPDKTLKVPLYATFGSIPEGVKVPDNVSLNVVNCGSGRFPCAYFNQPDYWQDAISEIDGFNQLSKQKIWIWMHYPHSPRIINGLAVPYPVPHFMQQYLALNKDKIVGLYLNGHYTSSFALDGLMIYLWYKLLWNPDIDVDALVEEYVRTLWGPVSGEIKEYYATIIKQWESTQWKNIPKPGDFNFNIPVELVWRYTYPKAVRDRLKNELEQAAKKANPGSIYQLRAKYLLAGNTSFFEQGDFYDRKVVTRGDSARLSPVIDGRLDEWKDVRGLPLTQNLTGKPADTKSVIYTAYDDRNFYVAGEVEQNGWFTSSNVGTGRDSGLWNNDSVEIFISPYRDGFKEAGLPVTSHYYQIIIDSRGNIYDAYKSENSNQPDSKENLNFELKTVKTDKRFTFEIKIPLDEMKTKIVPGMEWRVNFFRNRYENSPVAKSYAWAASRNHHDTQNFGVLVFPYPLLWSADFTGDKTMRVETPVKNFVVSIKNEDGKCRIHYAGDSSAAVKEIKLVLDGIPEHKANGNAIVEWKYSLSGKGLMKIRSYGAQREPNLSTDNYMQTLPEEKPGFCTIRQEMSKDKKTLKSIDYFAVGLTPASLADFDVTIDSIKVFDKTDVNAK